MLLNQCFDNIITFTSQLLSSTVMHQRTGGEVDRRGSGRKGGLTEGGADAGGEDGEGS